MKKFKVSITVEAQNIEQLQEKLEAFQKLQNIMNHEDLLQAVELIESTPQLIPFIKEVIPKDGQSLGVFDYINIAKKAYSKFS